MKSKKIWIILVCCAVLFFMPNKALAMTVEEASQECADTFQKLTDQINSLSADSTPEEVATVKDAIAQAEFPEADETVQEESSRLAGSMTDADFADVSLNAAFAQLQQELSQSAKNTALGNIEQIESLQAEQSKVAAYLAEARQLQAEAASSGESTEMPDEMLAYMDTNGLKYDTTDNDHIHSRDEWDVAIQSLMAKDEDIGTGIQQAMVYVQDYMGQYNSYAQAARTAIERGMGSSNQVARGQTMAGGAGSAGLMVTCGLAGVVLGVAATLLALKLRKKNQG